MYSILILFFVLISNICGDQDAAIYSDADLSSMLPTEIESLGRVAHMGELYDMRYDKFLQQSIFNGTLKECLIKSTEIWETKLHWINSHSYQEKFNVLDISGQLQVNILSGLVKLEGSGGFFKNTKKSARSAKVTLINSISTKMDTIDISHCDVQSLIVRDVIETTEATHIVVGIHWGGKVFISVEDSNSDDEDSKTIHGNLKASINKLAGIISANGSASVKYNDRVTQELSNYSFDIFGDILPDTFPETIVDAMKFMQTSPAKLKKANQGKGKPVKYAVIPIQFLRKLWKINTTQEVNSIFKQIDKEIIHKSVEFFDEMSSVMRVVNDLRNDIKYLRSYIDLKKVRDVTKLQMDYSSFETRAKMKLQKALIEYRSKHGSMDALQEFISETTEEMESYRNISARLKNYNEINREIKFLKYLLKMKANILDKDTSLNEFLFQNIQSNAYVFFTNFEDPYKDASVYRTFDKIMRENKSGRKTNTLSVVVNYKYCEQYPNTTKISYYENGVLVVDNFNDEYNPKKGQNPDHQTLSEMRQEIINLDNGSKKPSVPIGYTYPQMGGTRPPQELWPDTKWVKKNVEHFKMKKHNQIIPVHFWERIG